MELRYGIDHIGALIEGIVALIENDGNLLLDAANDMNSALNKLFIGPDTIFSGNVMLVNANIFRTINVTEFEGIKASFSDSGEFQNLTSDMVSPGYHMVISIKQAIASIYRVLRDICGYIMLAALIYTGIRVLVTSNNPQKQSQWRALIFDWLVGMVLLIFSHVLMVGIFTISDLLVNALGQELNGFGGMNFNLVVQCFLSWDSAEQIVSLVMLGYLIYLTVVFTVAYFKRFMWICILIVIAPIVSIMYAFGNQTKQIYSKWLREYITTVLVQPFHIVVYYILVSIPLNIVNSTGEGSVQQLFNPGASLLEVIYALVAMSFIRPAEKYIRNLFEMDKGISSLASFDSGKQTINEIKAAFQKLKERMARTQTKALTVAGAVIGGYFGGPQGAKAGAQLGHKAGRLQEEQVKKQGKKDKDSEKKSELIDSRRGRH